MAMSSVNSMPDPTSPEFGQYFESLDRFAEKIGYRVISTAPGTSEYEISVDESFYNPVGIVHGGALFSVMDSSAGAAMAAWARASGRELTFMATATAEIRYKRAVTGGTLRVRTAITEQKRSVVRLTSQAFDASANPEPVAELVSTWFVRFAK